MFDDDGFGIDDFIEADAKYGLFDNDYIENKPQKCKKKKSQTATVEYKDLSNGGKIFVNIVLLIFIIIALAALFGD